MTAVGPMRHGDPGMGPLQPTMEQDARPSSGCSPTPIRAAFAMTRTWSQDRHGPSDLTIAPCPPHRPWPLSSTREGVIIPSVSRRVSSPVLIGRAIELGELASAFDRARRGAPELILIAGEAGAGKSRLIAEFVNGMAAADTLVLQGLVPRPARRRPCLRPVRRGVPDVAPPG